MDVHSQFIMERSLQVVVNRESEEGFTLIESVVVLFIAMTLSSMVLHYTYKFMAHHSEQDALDLFVASIYEMQAYSMGNYLFTHLYFTVRNGTTYYIVENANEEELIVQALPPSMTLDPNSRLRTVLFHPNGNILEFGSLTLATQRGKVRLAFQMQRGRVIVHVE